jgi:membrane protease YdiL (CAAX protease family)
MLKSQERRDVSLFVLVSFLYSWPIFFCVDGWLEPMLVEQDKIAAARIVLLFGHLLGMLGPALAALFMWRVRRQETPAWSWSRPRYYGIAALAMLALWTLPGLIGLALGDTLESPIETHMWIGIAAMLALGWIAGMGEEVGWCAYLLPRLSPHIGKTRAAIVSGVIRGLWHWPVLVGPIIAQVVAGERTIFELIGAGVVIALQLVITNVFFGSLLAWVWYRTESIPLVGWLHYWHNLARDVTITLLVSYGSSLWATQLNGLVLYPLCFILLDQVRIKEGLEWKQILGRAKPQASGEIVE